MMHRQLALIVTAVMAASASVATQQPTDAQPRFKASVEVTSIDVGVVDGQGKPLLNLAPEEFSVRVDGKARRVVSVEWVSLAAPAATERQIRTRVPDGYSSNETSTGGRLVAIAVDEPHIRPGGAAAVLAAASAFIDRLSPSDRLAAVSLGIGGTATPFVADRERIKTAIGKMSGQWDVSKTGTVTVTASEAVEIADGNRLILDQAVSRECAGLRAGTSSFLQCRTEVETEAVELASQVIRAGSITVKGLRELLTSLQVLDGPKTLILMSEGFSVRDAGLVNELGSLAAMTRTSIYALKLDNQLFELTNARLAVNTLTIDARNDGLETLAFAARGTLFTVNGTGSQLFTRIEAELSGYYLLGVESDPSDRDGKAHSIRIDVSRRGATVRARRQVLNAIADLRRPQTPREAVTASLTAPLLLSGLPLRIATFALRGPESSKVQILIRADVGTDYAATTPAVVGYVIQDRRGRIVENRTVTVALAPLMNGVPGSLQYSAGASVDPGDYTIKLAVAQGDRVGSVEHPVHAVLADLGEVALSDLMVGGPTDAGDLLHPSVGYTVSFGTLHGYVEAYGAHVDQVAAKYEIAANADGPVLITADVPARRTSADRALLTHAIPVAKLPAGEYVLRAIVTSSGEPLKTLVRPFEIAPPAVLMTSATVAASATPSANGDLFLPVEDEILARPFTRDEALGAQTLEPFLQRVPATTKTVFEQGIAELRKSNYAAAESSFKRAIRPDVDSTSALAYLAATMAAAGHDAEAASVWQTALVDGEDLPQLYEWLGQTLARTRDHTGARSILEEAAGRWPSDARFLRPLAMVYATLGKGRDAIRMLDRYISAGHVDPDLLFLGVEWIFQAHNNRSVVINPSADLTLARNYAAQYAKSNGPKMALVQQWIDFLNKETR